ncbi:hypothetical protein F6V30_09360 [Oryzomonas sagensis]|uniref:YvrJ family protein n=1 Tax=Oryzomonas sagensis TaxID=2603857 RepID=A0ABQ6TP96_9BACT|nr:hypothetical protein [Oryzomonas sagensis]KAB0670350.1 hypothetical protein F6V30_09360 [Oryzomonas sagensis]
MNIPTEVWEIVKICLSVGGAYVLVKIDRNQSELFSRLREIETSFAKLQGKCDAMHAKSKV